jgi:hypothetical protein
LPTYSGSCHCGAVKFRITADITEMTTCDCSLCTRKNALMTAVPHANLTITEGKELLSKYEWNTKIAKHYFCSRCGIYTFHSKRMLPDHYGVNVYCLEGFDPSTVPVRRTEGLGLTVADANARPEWRGPKEANS